MNVYRQVQLQIHVDLASAVSPVSVNTWTRLAGFNRYEPTYECQHLDPTRRFLHRSWVLHIDPAQTMYAQFKLAYQVRQVDV